MTEVALAHTGDRRVDGHDERAVAGRFRARDGRFGHRAAAWDVELIPERAAGVVADFFEPRAGERGQDVAGAGGARLASGVDLATRIEHAAETDRREHERQCERGAEHGRAQVATRHGHTLTRAKRHVAKRADVLVKRDLVLGAAVDVGEDDAADAGARGA